VPAIAEVWNFSAGEPDVCHVHRNTHPFPRLSGGHAIAFSFGRSRPLNFRSAARVSKAFTSVRQENFPWSRS